MVGLVFDARISAQRRGTCPINLSGFSSFGRMASLNHFVATKAVAQAQAVPKPQPEGYSPKTVPKPQRLWRVQPDDCTKAPQL